MLLQRVLSCCALLALTCLLVACGEDDRSGSSGSQPLKVVATTTQAADLAANVGGDHVDVVGLLAPNADPHAYEPRPRDVQALTDAALVVRSGGEIDAWLSEAIKSSGTKAPVVRLIDSVKTLEGGAHDHEEEHAGEAEHADEDEHAQEQTDPHWWQDPRNGALATTALGDALAKADPSRAAAYRSAAAQYGQRLHQGRAGDRPRDRRQGRPGAVGRHARAPRIRRRHLPEVARLEHASHDRRRHRRRRRLHSAFLSPRTITRPRAILPT